MTARSSARTSSARRRRSTSGRHEPGLLRQELRPRLSSAAKQDALEKEELEDRYFTGNPDGLQYENHESVDSSVWVPNGYVCIRVDARGVGNSPGLQAPFSVQQAEDYYDAIEWAGTQPWSNGNVGLWGMSYLAITQHTVASLQPPHLKAMIALGTDADLYNEAIYGGGLFGEGFWTWWRAAMAGHNYNGERRETDWLARMLATPFNDPDAYGRHGSIFMRPEIEKATAPVWIVGPQTGRRHPPARQQRNLHLTRPVCSRQEVRLRRRLVPAQLQEVDDRRTHGVLRPLAQGRGQRRDGWRPGTSRRSAPATVRTTSRGDRVADRADRHTGDGTSTRRPSDWNGDGRRTDFLRISEEPPTTEDFGEL